MKFPEYLGDGVYAVYDGWHIWLRLSRHDNTEGQIALEPSVYAALVRYHDGLAKRSPAPEETTPAQAACDGTEACKCPLCWGMPAQAAEPEPNPEEPTCGTCGRLLAVCECGPLAALFGAIHDMPAAESADGTRSYELRTVPYHDPGDVARIAELEATNARLNGVLKQFDKLCENLDPPDILVHWLADRTRIDQAVEERDLAENLTGELSAKLLRLYDAALARAEAAERKFDATKGLVQSTEAMWAGQVARAEAAEGAHVESQMNGAKESIARKAAESRLDAAESDLKRVRLLADTELCRAVSAESRLAEATALLKDWHKYVRNSHPLIWSNTDAFLSGSTPAPAAPHAGIGAGGGDDKDYDDWRSEAIAEGRAKLRAEKKCRAVEVILATAQPHAIPGTVSADAFERALAVLAGGPAQAAEPAETAADTAADRAIADCRAAIDSLAHPDTIALRELAAAVGQALVVASLGVDESLVQAKDHAIVNTMLNIRADLTTAKQYAADCERTATLNQQENVELKRDLATARALAERIEMELGATRWRPEGSVSAWASTREGLNHGCVMRALDLIRSSKGEGANMSRKRGKYSAPDSAWCEICDGHHGPGQHPEPPPAPDLCLACNQEPHAPGCVWGAPPAPEAPALPEGLSHEDFYRDVNVGASTGPYWVKLGRLSTLLASQGLRVVTEAEGKVLDKLNTPETASFDAGVPLEALHQQERWGVEHDAGKEAQDWFWLIGYLAGKALHSAKSGDVEKALHHCISTAAVLRNWHAHIRKPGQMRPGIDGEAELARRGNRG